jgi:predicted branched-subunit amino acid permease
LLALEMIGMGAPALLIVLTAALLNLRHVLYSASVAPHLQHLNVRRWKVVLAYLLTDEAYAISIGRLQAERPPRLSHWHLLGSGLLLWVQWQLSTLVGVLVGGAIPARWDLDFVLPATFIALVFPSLKDRPMLAAALSAGAVAVLTAPLPHKLNVLLAAFTGIAVGMLVQRLGCSPGA